MVEIPKEKWSGKIGEVVIGATKEEGGTRSKKVVVGGTTVLPFMYFEGKMGHKPPLALEVLDVIRDGYPKVVRELMPKNYSPIEWAKICQNEYNADLICLKLISTSPEEENTSVEEAVKIVENMLKAVSIPLMIYGSGDYEKDAKVLEECAKIAEGERCVLGKADEDGYKSIAAASMAYNHAIIAFSNLDINLAKQINILLKDFDVKKENIIMDPLMAGIGYGVEYSYSVIERIRLAALMGDKMLQMPIVCDTSCAWDARESYEENPSYGDVSKRGLLWESATATSALMAGADMLILRHPKALKLVKKTIDELWKGGE